ncbi:class II aldolase/adducin family protein [Candidatus Poseidoniales archaeon]|nr:class II aldolase/adducin family protein [Candidatus Poseidoniales archaeon]
MAGKKTSAEQAREQAEEATLGSMLDGAFGAMDGIEGPPEPEPSSPEPIPTETPEPTSEPTSDPPVEAPGPSGPLSGPPTEAAPGPTGPPTGPPSGPPSAPPTETPAPSGPPGGPPSGPPSGPPTEAAPGPTGPPTGPPSGPPSAPPTEPPTPTEEVVEEEVESTEEQTDETSEPSPEVQEEQPAVEEPADAPEEAPEEIPEPIAPESEEPEQPAEDVEPSDETAPEPATQEEIERLTAEIERLRGSLVGASEVIEELEETPMPPIVFDNIVVAPHLVADFARMGRQLNRANLVKGSMGSMSMLHPDEPGLMISTRHSTSLARLDERGIVGGHLGGEPPRGAIADWKVHEVLLASVSVVTGGPAAAIHMHGPYTTAASCEKDLIIVQPIDVIGKEQIGKVVIVDPDGMDTDFLRQVAEALNQGGLRCVVVRGHGAYAVGANLDQAMANAAMLEHSMQILLLARQANLKF